MVTRLGGHAMSQKNVETVRRGYELFAAGDVQGAAALFSADAEVGDAGGLGIAGTTAGTRHGAEGFLRSTEEAADASVARSTARPRKPSKLLGSGGSDVAECGPGVLRRAVRNHLLAMADSQACAGCGVLNPAGARFCMSCGAPLGARCPACGVEPPPRARFCPSCGASLSGADGPPRGSAVTAPGESVTAATAAVVEERRTVSVLFADVSGYTSVAERLDHETVKSLIGGCLTRLAVEVDCYGGHVDKYIGDSVMAVFGAPASHEDDPERAVRAALGMQQAMVELNASISRAHGFELALRVGVNTGEVLAGIVGDAYTVMGDVVNVASRLQAAAPDGGVLVGERTRRATSAAIEYGPIEHLALKGKHEPVAAFGVIEVRELASGRDRAEQRETPLVGRREELAELGMAFERVRRAKSPQLMTIIGQPGVGKTRVLREFERKLKQRAEPVSVRRGRCLPFGTSVVYWPLSEVLRAECGILDGDPGSVALEKLDARLRPLLATQTGDADVSRRIAALARLVGVDTISETATAEPDDPQSARESFFGAVRAAFEGIASEAPLVLAWEDIHWADEGMLELIEYLSRWLRAPVLQICLARAELLGRAPAWGAARRSVTSIFLEPLPEDDTRELISVLLGTGGATGEVLESLTDRAGGNPLFAEELVKRIVEEGAAKVTELPDTVHGVLAARLDSLGPFERHVLQHAAVMGRTFWEAGLEQLAHEEPGDPKAALVALREKDLIVFGEASGLAEEPELAFKHVLIRDVAYGMLPKAIRARKHREVAEFLEHRAGERGEEVIGLLAEHYARAATLAGEVRLGAEELEQLRTKALACSESAGDAAVALYANREAVAHYESAETFAAEDDMAAARIAEKRGDVAVRLGRVDAAIEVWGRCLSHHEGRDQPEHVAELHRKIGAALAHKGERKHAIEHHQKGINLIKDLAPSLALVRLYEEAASLYMHVGDNMLAIYAAEKALRLADRLGEVRAASRAHGVFGRVFGRIGDIAKARENLERAAELARDSDPNETVLALLALGQHLADAEGDYPAAANTYREALELAQRIGDVPAQIELQAELAQLAFYRCDWDEVRRASEAAAELAEREGLIGKLCLADTLRAFLSWRDGQWQEAERLFSRAHERAEQIGWSEVSFRALLGLSVVMRDSEQLERAESALGGALAVCERAGLLAQSVQAHSARTVALILAGREEPARAAANHAATIADRIRYPVAEAASLEARGIAGKEEDAGAILHEARAIWERLGRRLEVARCDLLLGIRLGDHDPPAAARALADAVAAYDQLGIAHLATRARQLAIVA
jgi:class 3 adenylate cyclase/tetratricopeptide (TPR) repeat protein